MTESLCISSSMNIQSPVVAITACTLAQIQGNMAHNWRIKFCGRVPKHFICVAYNVWLRIKTNRRQWGYTKSLLHKVWFLGSHLLCSISEWDLSATTLSLNEEIMYFVHVLLRLSNVTTHLYYFNKTLFIEINQTLQCLAAVDNQAVDKP